jgi:hypothetical protein
MVLTFVQVWPAPMLWPAQFANTALLHALHDKDNTAVAANGWKIPQTKYYCIVLGGMFCYYWIPGVLWQGLSVFAFATW